MNDTRAQLEGLALNHRWSWHRPTRTLLDALPGASADQHPFVTVTSLDDASLRAWSEADHHAAQVEALATELDEVLAAPGPPRYAYFSPEFGVAEVVRQFSGGLGILAGDHCKAASDLAVPLVGIGLLYREGFFRQRLVDGRQEEYYQEVEPSAIGAIDTGTTVEVPVGGVDVRCRVWRQQVGATALLLLDTDVETNSEQHRKITDRLYSGDRLHRLHQELVLGIGGVRALRAVGIAPEVFHLNEGHACFLLLELLAELVDAGASLDDAVAHVRAETLFTTHTPVPAGIDRFDRAMIGPELDGWAGRLGTTIETLLDWGHLPADDASRPFNTAAFCLHLCGEANGVSALHGTVSRELFSSHPNGSRIRSITNGVHSRTWVGAALSEVFDATLGTGWADGEPEAWARAEALPDDTLQRVRRAERAALVELVAAQTGTTLDPDACVIGFARRFATYKRAALVLTDEDRLSRLLADNDRPVQFVFAGKAHPADAEGKAVLRRIAEFAGSSAAHGRFVLVPGYDMAVAQLMYAGCDVWLNNPRRPYEACGTSGEKAALNGALNLSILDGWWSEWYRADAGWALPTSNLEDPDERDRAEAEALYALLENDVVPLFYRDGRPGPAWWDLVRSGWMHLGPRVTAARMVREYAERYAALAAR